MSRTPPTTRHPSEGWDLDEAGAASAKGETPACAGVTKKVRLDPQIEAMIDRSARQVGLFLTFQLITAGAILYIVEALK